MESYTITNEFHLALLNGIASREGYEGIDEVIGELLRNHMEELDNAPIDVVFNRYSTQGTDRY